jgi:Flp pilus assembly protein TadG
MRQGLSPLRRHRAPARRLRLDQRGSIMPIMAVLILVSAIGGAVAVDLTRAHALREQLQTAADSAALAAATMLPDTEQAAALALAYVAKNMPEKGEVLRAYDITFGRWNAAGRAVVTTEANPNVVQVVTRLAEANNNAVTTLMAGILGVDSMDVSAVTIRRRPPFAPALSDADWRSSDIVHPFP